jgi:hypothetical protein
MLRTSAAYVAWPLEPTRTCTRGRLRSFCGPLSLSVRSVCGLQTNEQPRTRANTLPDVQRFRGYSRVFAAVRGSRRQSGRTVRVGFPMRFFGALRGVCGGAHHPHARLGDGRGPAYAITNTRTRSGTTSCLSLPGRAGARTYRGEGYRLAFLCGFPPFCGLLRSQITARPSRHGMSGRSAAYSAAAEQVRLSKCRPSRSNKAAWRALAVRGSHRLSLAS